MTDPTSRIDLDELRGSVAVVAPGEPDWDTARGAWNLVPDQRPVAVAFPETADGVVAVVDFARERGLHVAPQATGHSAIELGALDNTILLKTSRMRSAAIDAERCEARVDAGAHWIDVTAPAAEHGLAGLAGTSPDVGVVGYTVGGGLGWLSRKFGLAANSVLAAELVTADGQLVRADAEHEPELFWAVRGGGGSFGIVTALEFRLYPVAELYAGALFWPVERASEILHAWRGFVDRVPDELASVGRLLHLPPLEVVPESFRGRSFVVVEAAYIGTEAEGRELVAPLRDLGPEIDTIATMAPPGLAALHMDPHEPVPGLGDGVLVDRLPPDAIDAVVKLAGPGSGSPLLSVELRHLGGALPTTSPDHGAVGAIEADFLMFAVGVAATPELAAAVDEGLVRVRDALAPWDAGRTFLNFTERPVDTDELFPPETARRLRELKRRVDPQAVIRTSHPVAPA
jgi:hypothetical protein